jgi:Skp family chaperone for outer membrane proteins
VKKLIFATVAAALVAGFLVGTRSGVGQETTATSPAAGPHQVGLIDMAQVFKEYEKFKTLSDGLRAEVEASDEEAKVKIEELQTIQAQLTSGTLTEGSAEFTALEQSLVSKSSELETFRKMKQRDFLRAEADIYKTVYLEVQDAVQKYARYYKYTLIMRFNRDKVEDAENPQEIIQSMNRPVVFHRAEDDLTDPILNFLNGEYRKTAGLNTPAGTAPATATRSNTTRPN